MHVLVNSQDILHEDISKCVSFIGEVFLKIEEKNLSRKKGKRQLAFIYKFQYSSIISA